MEVIRTSKVTKYYGLVSAVSDITLNVDKGEIYGFLGLNGAGKTTLIRIILGMVKADRGQVHLFGKPVYEKFNYWNKVGFLVESPSSYSNLTVYENLKHYFYLRKMENPKDIMEVIDILGLSRFIKTKSKYLSLGNKQRLGLAKAMLHRPELLILDEPINGLDPAGVVEIRNLIKRLSEAGTTVFLSSHNLEEVWRVIDKVGIIHEGVLLEEQVKGSINSKLKKTIRVHTNYVLPSYLLLSKHGYKVKMNEDDSLVITGEKAIFNPEYIIELLVKSGNPPAQFIQNKENLENYFLRTINERNGAF